MNLDNGALVLEGGGLRGVYTSGVLRFFMDKRVFLPYVIGASMGACNAANYLSRQPERNRIVNIRYVNDARYLSYYRLFAHGELFGMEFIFNAIPRSLVPFDFETFTNNDAKCVIIVTDCESGEAVYYKKNELGEDYLKILQASCSLPFVAKPVHYKGRIYMDGGLSDAVPIRKSIDDGNIKNIVILTRPKAYRKKPTRLTWFAKILYPRYKGLRETLASRHLKYNETMDFIDLLEERDKVFVIRPQLSLNVSRAERNKDKLYAVYDQGYSDASTCYERLCAYLN
ncbi:patatin family protein [Thermodesulfobacteriota bacterium]